MLRSFQDIFKIPELRRKILFTLGIIVVYRIGAIIPVPGIDIDALKNFAERESGTLFGFLDLFSGGALSRFSIFSLGIMPYINASIIMSLLQTVIPYLEQLSKEGDVGRKKITQYTRYGTVFLACIQGFGLTMLMQGSRESLTLVKDPGISFLLMAVLTLVTGTIFIMWLGEQITEYGIGNGISLIIFSGIIVRIPSAVGRTIQLLRLGEISLLTVIFLLIVAVSIVAAVIFVEQGQRRIPVQYAKRIVGRRMYGGQNTYLPLRVDQSGVIAVIFAMSLLMFPMTIASYVDNDILKTVTTWLTPGHVLYTVIYVALIIFFCYFYTAITFNPHDLANNMKRYGGFIPGIRAGNPTADYINKILTRITLIGALFVASICTLPDIIFRQVGVTIWTGLLGGTAILIVVGVALDTIGQVEIHLIMRHY